MHTDGSYGGSKNNKWRIDAGEGYVETYYDYKVFGDNNTHVDNDDDCDNEISPIPPIKQTSIYGKTFCGRRNGEPFETVIRPDLDTRECPTGTTPCSLKTSPDNTVCYPPESHGELCPITEVFVASTDEGDGYKNNPDYTVVDYHEDEPDYRYVVYSKTMADSLPITTTAIDREPCLNPTQASTYGRFYPTELSRGDSCQDYRGVVHDPRYVSFGETITEYDFQDESGVLRILT